MRGDYSTSGPKLSSTVAQKSVKVGTFQQKGVLSDKLLVRVVDYEFSLIALSLIHISTSSLVKTEEATSMVNW